MSRQTRPTHAQATVPAHLDPDQSTDALAGRLVAAVELAHTRAGHPDVPPCTYAPDLFFPVRGQLGAQAAERAALTLCGMCPNRQQCLADALDNWETGAYGIWGGTTEAERAQMRDLFDAMLDVDLLAA